MTVRMHGDPCSSQQSHGDLYSHREPDSLQHQTAASATALWSMVEDQPILILYLDQIRPSSSPPNQFSPLPGSMLRIYLPSPDAPRQRAYVNVADLFSRPAPLAFPITSSLSQVLILFGYRRSYQPGVFVHHGRLPQEKGEHET